MARRATPFSDRKATQIKSWIPSPDEIRQRAAEIRRSWSPEERQQREVAIPGWPLLPVLLKGRRMQPAAVPTDGRHPRGRR